MDAAQKECLIAFHTRDVEAFERAVYARQYETAGQLLLALLNRVNLVFGVSGYKVSESDEHYLYTRIAAAMIALFADEGFTLQPSGFTALALRQAMISALLECSGFGGSDHLLRLLGTRRPGSPEVLNFPTLQAQLKLLLAFSLDSGIDLDLAPIFRQDPVLLLPAWLGMTGRTEVLTDSARRRHEQLLRLGPLFENVESGIEMLTSLSTVWMNCMYGTAQDRHAVKRPLNVLARRMLGPGLAGECAPDRPRRPLADRPVMLLPLEHFRVPHVNYRTYAAMIRRLRERFVLVAAAGKDDLDETTAALFDRVVMIEPPGERGFGPMIEALAGVGADIVFYPTLGIQWWWIPVCNFRLAPIQAMTIGVPATSHSAAMDYVVVEESWPGEPECYSETLVHTRAGSTRFQPRDVGKHSRLADSGTAGTLHIAVSALVTKLNAAFLDTCREIDRRSSVPLEWHFFAGMTGLHHALTRRQIRDWLPAAEIHGYLEYPEFTAALAGCDLHLSTFPFGGTNSNLDSMQLGIPMVTLRGPEAHSQIDTGMLRRAGLPDWLSTDTPEAYVETALRLIGAPKERAKLRRQLLALDVDKEFSESGAKGRDDFVDAFCWLYENHEALRRDGRKCWTTAARKGLKPGGGRARSK